MHDLPAMLKLEGKRIVVIGGGAVAARRVAAAVSCGADVHVIAPTVEQSIIDAGVIVKDRTYREGDLTDAFAVIIATDDPPTNEAVATEARQRNVLVNRTDAPELGDFVVPAHRRHGPVTIAAATDGISAAAARQIIEQLDAAFDDDWAVVLEVVRPYRKQVQSAVVDAAQRQAILRRLTDGEAVAAYKSGGIEALTRHARKVAGDAQ
jgi:precorrin-2 dehydrogenase/sirohydrochlorin ferrochelatase